MNVLLPFLLGILYATAQTPACTQCSTTWSACYTANPAAPCTCHEAYANCIGQNNCNLLASSCSSLKIACPSVVCPNLGPSGIPCLDCSTNFNNCYNGDYTKICNCAPTYENCLSSNTCGVSVCNSYKPLCASLQCAAPTGCAKCSYDYSNCIMASPTSPCTCLDSLQQCISTCGVINTTVTDPFGTTCLIYQQTCPSINCPPATPCGQCVVDYLPCATAAIKTGDFQGGMCQCLDTMMKCLTNTSCIATPYSSLCPFYSSFCPNMQCSGRSQLAQQVAGLIDQYRSLVSEYLQSIFNGTTIQFGVSVARGSNRVVPITITLPDNDSIQTFLDNLKIKLAEYFKADANKIVIRLTAGSGKRAQNVNAEMVLEGNSGSSISSGVLTLLVAIVIALVYNK